MALVMPASLQKISAQRLNGLFVVARTHQVVFDEAKLRGAAAQSLRI
jgi:hypothetical protein